jgi:hypothetical protein
MGDVIRLGSSTLAATMIAACCLVSSARADRVSRDDRLVLVRLEALGGYGPGFDLGRKVGHAPRVELGAAFRALRFGVTVQPYVRDVWKDSPDRLVIRSSAFVGGRLALDHGLAVAFDALLGASRFRVNDSAGLFSPATVEATHWLPHLGARARLTFTFPTTLPLAVIVGAELAVYADLKRKSFDPHIDGAPAEAGGVGFYPAIVFGGTWRSAKTVSRRDNQS